MYYLARSASFEYLYVIDLRPLNIINSLSAGIDVTRQNLTFIIDVRF